MLGLPDLSHVPNINDKMKFKSQLKNNIRIEFSYAFVCQDRHSVAHANDGHRKQEQNKFERILVEFEAHRFGE